MNKSVDSVDRCNVCEAIINDETLMLNDETCWDCGVHWIDADKSSIMVIHGTFPSLNQYIAAMNRNRHIGNKMKQDETDRVQWLATQVKQKFTKVQLTFRWYEKNRKRDLDNVAFAKKFILDGLVKAGVIPNDGWKNVVGFEDKFFVDKDNPRVVVEILEVE